MIDGFLLDTRTEFGTAFTCVFTTQDTDDPDAGLELKRSFVAQLRKQAERVSEGDRGTPLDNVLRELVLK